MCALCNNSSANFSNAGALPANTGSSAASSDHLLTGIQNVDAIIADTYWTTTKLKFTFPTSGDWFTYLWPLERKAFAPFSDSDKAAVRLVLNKQFASVSLLTFEERDAGAGPVDAQLTFAYGSRPGADGWAYTPNIRDYGGDTWYSAGVSSTLNSQGQSGWEVLIHEIGHALGLKHGHYERSWEGKRPFLTSDRDTTEFSVMTYNRFSSESIGLYEYSHAQSLGMYDIAALQNLYGASFNTNSTNSVYSFSPANGSYRINGIEQGRPSIDPNGIGCIFMTIWDGGGIDTYDFSNHGDSQQISLAPGEWSLFSQAQRSAQARANIYNALQFRDDTRSLIENAIGGPGSDFIVGNVTANQLTGGDGDDTLDGGAANDSLNGGAGNDTFLVGSGNLAFGGAGEDVAIIGLARLGTTITVNGNVQTIRNGSFRTTLTDIEQVQFLGESTYSIDVITIRFSGSQILHYSPNAEKRNLVFGNSLANTIVGNRLAETIDGGGGNDSIRGEAGNDILSGGLGQDELFGGDGSDTLDGGAEGDGLFGGGGADIIQGGDGDDAFYGGEGNDSLDGGAGNDDLYGVDGNDSLIGGTGNDGLYGEDGDDSMIGGIGNDGLYGEDGNDSLIGGTGNDRLDGGAGNDTLDGGAGNDTLRAGWGDTIFGSADNDLAIFDFARAGISTTVSGTVYTLRSGSLSVTLSDVERVQFQGESTWIDITTLNTVSVVLSATQTNYTGTDSTKNYAITGNELSNILIGNRLGDTIDGGAGNDQVRGEEGNDSLLGGAGSDILDGGANDDVLDAGDGNDQLFGEDGNDTLLGGIGNDWLDGSEGNDSLAGGAGNDWLTGYVGDDFLAGGADNDRLDGGAGNDNLDGGAGNDTLRAGWGDTIFGGADNDLAIFDFARAGISTTVSGNVYTLRNGTLSVTLSDVDRVQFAGESSPTAITTLNTVSVGLSATQTNYTGTDSTKNYAITGNALSNILIGNRLGDTIDGGAGNDQVRGEEGNDSLLGGAGSDILDGGANDDVLDAGDGNDQLFGEDGNDTLLGGIGNDWLHGSEGNDSLAGGAGNDWLTGHVGDDFLAGGADNDRLDGGAGNDNLDGGAGNDTLRASFGDSLIGGADNDLAIFDFARAGISTTVSGNVYTLRNDTLSVTLSDVERVQFLGESAPTAISSLAGSLSQRTALNQTSDLPFAW